MVRNLRTNSHTHSGKDSKQTTIRRSSHYERQKVTRTLGTMGIMANGTSVVGSTKATPHKKKQEDPKPKLKSQAKRELEVEHKKENKKLNKTPHVNLLDLYEIEGLLGTGSFGKVYQAKQKDQHATHSKVAIKVIEQRMTTNVELDREITALQTFADPGHNHVCRLFSTLQDARYFYLVMERVGGRELFEHLSRKGAFSEKYASRFLEQFADGIAYIHERGFIHADLKPENLMLDRWGDYENAQLKIVDFGFCVSQASSEEIQFGTIAYLPPEHAKIYRKPRRPTVEADMYAAGVIMYTILTGTHPFDPSNRAPDDDIARAVVRSATESDYLDNFVFDKRRTTGLSSSAMLLARTLLYPDPNHRTTAREFQSHPWILGVSATSTMLPKTTVSNLQQFWQKRFRLAVLKKFGINRHLSEGDLRVLFERMDLNGDNKISLAELKSGFRNLLGTGNMMDILCSIDIKNTGFLDFDEFKSVMRCKAEGDPDKKIRGSFVRRAILKTFGSPEAITASLSRDVVRSIFDEMDLNKDGSVQLSEAIAVLTHATDLDEQAVSAWVSFVVRFVFWKLLLPLSASKSFLLLCPF